MSEGLGIEPEGPRLRVMTPQAVLFDLDGTLVDQFAAIHRSCNYAERQLGLPESSFEKVRSVVGGSIDLTLERLVGKEKAPEAHPYYQECFEKVWFEGLTTMPGARWVLKSLKANGVACGLLTNKRQDGVENIIRFLHLEDLLDCIVGTHAEGPRGGWRKPEARLTEYALEQLGAEAEGALLIGDSPFDAQTGHNVGMPVHLVTTGTHSGEQLADVGAAGIYPNLYLLAHKVFGLMPPSEAAEASS